MAAVVVLLYKSAFLGMDLRPNTASSIAVQLTNITRLPAPFISNCTLGWNQTGYTSINTTIRYTLAVSSLLLHYLFIVLAISVVTELSKVLRTTKYR